jgi:2-iminobutanoate/2-iminopropanoate deaminase
LPSWRAREFENPRDKENVTMVERVILGREGGAYSAAVIADSGRVAFVSGQTARGETLEEQTTTTLTNLLRAIEAAGGKKENIVRCGCFLANIADFDEFNAVYRSFFGDVFPARTTVEAKLDGGALVEIDAVVAL